MISWHDRLSATAALRTFMPAGPMPGLLARLRTSIRAVGLVSRGAKWDADSAPVSAQPSKRTDRKVLHRSKARPSTTSPTVPSVRLTRPMSNRVALSGTSTRLSSNRGRN